MKRGYERWRVIARKRLAETRVRKKNVPGAPPPPPPLLPEPLELLDELDEELLLELEDEELLDDDDELLELLEEDDEELADPVYSSAPISKALPVGRGSPSISVVKPAIVVPALTTPTTAVAR